MAPPSEFKTAMTNRSLRTIRTELEFLTDASVITPQQLSAIVSQLPDQIELHAPLQQPQLSGSAVNQSPPTPYSPPTSQFAKASLNEKANLQSAHSASPPPPAYPQVPQVPQALSVATALYAYSPTDAGDLALQPHDRIQVLEHMNNDWWRGRNERTMLEGIFPRSYVNVIDEKSVPIVAPQPTSYGNLPLEVSQGSSSGGLESRRTSKFESQGKRIGKKMGDAAIFGAGATLGSNIVNRIF